MAEYIFRINGALYNEETGEAVMKPELVGELIRCKDCKHWYNAPASDGYNSCEKDALIRHESFFCGAAELRGEQE